jgi:hypothetical protein
VYVDVNETGHDELLPEIRCDLSGRRSTTCLGDPAAIDPQPTRSQNLAAADHGSGCDQLLGQHNADVSAGDRIPSADAEDVRTSCCATTAVSGQQTRALHRVQTPVCRLTTANEGGGSLSAAFRMRIPLREASARELAADGRRLGQLRSPANTACNHRPYQTKGRDAL